MKKIVILLLVLMGMSIIVSAQKYAFVDTDYIFKNIPEYTDAQDILNELSARWQKDVEKKYNEIERLYKNYQAESALLPADMKKKKQLEITNKEKELNEFRQQKFGPEGVLHKKRLELVQPIQEKIQSVITEIAESRNYAFIFDKAGGMNVLYFDSAFDLSDEVLDQLGMIVQSKK
jgi:outer membrane protein